jgi:hypothetical protein
MTAGWSQHGDVSQRDRRLRASMVFLRLFRCLSRSGGGCGVVCSSPGLGQGISSELGEQRLGISHQLPVLMSNPVIEQLLTFLLDFGDLSSSDLATFSALVQINVSATYQGAVPLLCWVNKTFDNTASHIVCRIRSQACGRPFRSV